MYKPQSAKEDFSPSMLPHTRKEVFFDVIKLNYRVFIVYGLLMLLFSLPFHLTAILEGLARISLTDGYASASPEEQKTILSQMLMIENVRAVLDIISCLILSIGISGIARVIRQHAWGENVFFSSELCMGIKQNYKQMMGIGLLVGVVNLIFVYACNISFVTDNKILVYSAMISAGALIVLGIPVFSYAMVSICVYEKKLFSHLLSGFVIFVKAPFRTIAAIICCFIPFLIQLIPIAGRMICSILMPFVLLAWFLFALARFDEFINRDRFPELVGKGLFPIDNSGENNESSRV